MNGVRTVRWDIRTDHCPELEDRSEQALVEARAGVSFCDLGHGLKGVSGIEGRQRAGNLPEGKVA